MKHLGILCAMQIEAEQLLNNCSTIYSDTTVAGARLVDAELCGQRVVIATSGIGKVHAAIAVQMMIDRFAIDAVVNTGIAGGLYKELRTMDLVVAERAVQHDFDMTAIGRPRGYIPGVQPKPEDGDVSYFDADPALIAAFEKAMQAFEDQRYFKGVVASGDMFLADPTYKAQLVERYNAVAGEMEGAAVAQVAHANQIPFLVLRAISDLADGDAAMTYDEFEQNAAYLSAKVMMELLKTIA